MASKIKVDNIENQCGGAVVTKCGATTTISGSVVKADDIQAADGGNIINQCGTTITLGASGDTINLASGASQSGFGRTGTVDWETTKKTASFTAANGEGYFVDSSSSAITVTLPASPSAGNIVSVSDYNGSAGTNAITIARNSSNINGDASDYLITKEDSAVTLVYVDATVGWTSVQTSNTEDTTNNFVSATGGTETTCGNFKIHTFTGPGTFTVSSAGTPAGSNTVDYLVIAGGGNGGGDYGGGGGAGGYRFSNGTASGCYAAGPSPLGASALSVCAQAYPITVGAGGTGSGQDTPGNPGSNSIFSSITSTGGGAGGTEGPPSAAGAGGSGGGAMYAASGASGNSPPVSPPQGNPGGSGAGASPGYAGGGGGGAGAAGQSAPSTPIAGDGGAGLASSITGSSVTRAGGGGAAGGGNPFGQGYTPGDGGAGGGGNGALDPNGAGSPGTVNTGSGGGGANLSGPSVGGNGGSGIVVIRYKFQN